MKNYSEQEQAIKMHNFQKKLLQLMEKELTPEEAVKLAYQVRPVMTKVKGKLTMEFPTNDLPKGEKYWVDSGNIRSETYTWSPKELAKAKNLELVTIIETYHKYGAPVCLKPSVYEVLYQLPHQFDDFGICAFELFYHKTADLFRQGLEDYHCLQCALYKTTIPPEIAEIPVGW